LQAPGLGVGGGVDCEGLSSAEPAQAVIGELLRPGLVFHAGRGVVMHLLNLPVVAGHAAGVVICEIQDFSGVFEISQG